jgi:hypothetical protein
MRQEGIITARLDLLNDKARISYHTLNIGFSTPL